MRSEDSDQAALTGNMVARLRAFFVERLALFAFSTYLRRIERAAERTRTADLLITSELLNRDVQAHLSITRHLTSDQSEPLANR